MSNKSPENVAAFQELCETLSNIDLQAWVNERDAKKRDFTGPLGAIVLPEDRIDFYSALCDIPFIPGAALAAILDVSEADIVKLEREGIIPPAEIDDGTEYYDLAQSAHRYIRYLKA